MSLGDFQSGDDGGQRAAQFMRGVTKEPLSRAVAGFDARQHFVHGHCEGCDLVATVGYGYPFG